MAGNKRLIGTVVDFYEDRGFGFIKGNDGRNYFVHWSSIRMDGFRYLEPGSQVRFSAKRAKPNYEAYDVDILEAESAQTSIAAPATSSVQVTSRELEAAGNSPPVQITEEEQRLPIANRKGENPFARNKLIKEPGKFIARDAEVAQCVRFVRSFDSFIVSGDSGIGKSCLLTQIAEIVNGNAQALRRHNLPTNHVLTRMAISQYTCSDKSVAEDIMAHLVAGIRRDYLHDVLRNVLKLGVSLAWQAAKLYFGSTGKIEVKLHSEDRDSMHRLNQLQFYNFIDRFLQMEKRLMRVAGLVFVIDEVEYALRSKKVNFGSFARTTVEAMSQRGHDNICFVICGAGDTAAMIFEMYTAGPRFFQQIPLKGMSEEELKAIVKTYLKDTAVSINDEALDRIARWAGRSPSRLQMLAWECFDLDTDGTIDLYDVTSAAKSLTSKLENQFFDKFVQNENWASYFKILECIARNEDFRLTTDQIASEVDLVVKSVAAFCGHLHSEDVLVADDVVRDGSTKKTYRLKNQAAALYFRIKAERSNGS